MKTTLSELYNHYKGKLDVRAILEHYGAENCSETTSSDGTIEIVHSCILDKVEPHHAHGDATPSAWANVDKGLYCCAVYWAGDAFHLIAKMEGLKTFSEVGPLLSDFFVGGTKDTVSFRKEIDKLFAEPVYTVALPSYSEKVLDAWRGDVTHPYLWAQRGITHEAIGLLQLGWDRTENRIVFPHWWNGKLVGWQKRVIPFPPQADESWNWQWMPTYPQYPKYRNSTGFPKSETLYAYGFAHSGGVATAVVVESPMSVAKAYSLKIDPWEGRYGVVATFGSKVSKHQIELLRDFPRVIVWPDGDDAGALFAHKIVSGLYRHTEVLVVSPDPGRDLGDCETPDEVTGKLDAALAAPLWLAQEKTHDPPRTSRAHPQAAR